MDSHDNLVIKNIENAKVALNVGLYDAAANYIRQVGEVLANFYLKKFRLNENDKGELVYSLSYNRAINTLWKSNHPVFNKIKKSLLNFLCLAQEVGNKGSHFGESVEKWEVEFLILYFENYIKTQFKVDCGVWPFGPDDLTDVTPQFHNKNITIYSMKAGHYASTKVDFDNHPICCDFDDRGKEETYTVQVDHEGWASFKAYTGRYLSVDMDARGEMDCPPIRAIGPESSAWEKFKIYRVVDGYYAFKARKNNKWVMCQAEWEKNPLFAASENVDWWEEFDIKEI